MKFLIEIPDNEVRKGKAPAGVAARLQEFLRDEAPIPSHLTVTALTDLRVAVTVVEGAVESIHCSSQLAGIEMVVVDHDTLKHSDGLDVEERDEVQLRETEGLVEQGFATARSRQFLNRYRHFNCPVQPDIEWVDQWSCACNDRCPACNAEIEPYASEELPPA